MRPVRRLRDGGPESPSGEGADLDTDGAGDACDLCPNAASPAQADGDPVNR